MKKLVLVMAALTMLMTCAVAEDTGHTFIGGADGPTAIYLSVTSEPSFGSVTLITARLGKVIARFDEKDALPMQGEHIMVYTNGTMIMPLPAVVDVIAWSSLLSDDASCR